MSVESEILRIQNNIADAYAKIAEKGGSVPSQSASANLAAAVESIPSGGTAEDLLAARLSDTMISYSNSEITSVVAYGFAYQKKLEEVSLPACTSLGTAAFYACTSLVALDMPELVSISVNTFAQCALTEFVSGDKFNSGIDASAFAGCSKIVKIDLRHVRSFGAQSLNCAILSILIVRNTDFVPPMHANTFGAETTAMNQGAGHIYVPASMVDAYRGAENWEKYAAQIRAIEDYPDICG